MRDFVKHHIDFTADEIDLNLPKPYSNEIKIKLTANAPIRQAYKHMKREQRYAKKLKAAGIQPDKNASPASMLESNIDDPTPRVNDKLNASGKSNQLFTDLQKNFSIDPIYMQEMPEKKKQPYFKFLSPKKDKFSKRNKTLDSNRKADIKLRQSNTKQYS